MWYISYKIICFYLCQYAVWLATTTDIFTYIHIPVLRAWILLGISCYSLVKAPLWAASCLSVSTGAQDDTYHNSLLPLKHKPSVIVPLTLIDTEYNFKSCVIVNRGARFSWAPNFVNHPKDLLHGIKSHNGLQSYHATPSILKDLNFVT